MLFSRRRLVVAFLAAGLVSSCTTYAFTGATRTADLTPEVIARRINEVRLASGVKAWTYNSRLADAAREQVGLMVAKNTLSHDLGATLRERVTRAGYDGAVGENVAKGYPTLEGAIEGWLKSAGHRSTLLSSKFVEFGLSYKRGKGGVTYWSMIAGGPFSAWY